MVKMPTEGMKADGGPVIAFELLIRGKHPYRIVDFGSEFICANNHLLFLYQNPNELSALINTLAGEIMKKPGLSWPPAEHETAH